MEDDHLDLTEPTKICPNKMDIIEESIYYFRANVFLKKFEINNPIDRLLIYLTVYILECLKHINRTCVIKKQAKIQMFNFAKHNFWMNNNSNTVLNFIYKRPDNKEAGLFLRAKL